MPIDWSTVPEPDLVGRELHESMADLFPLPRSLTGNGVRATLAMLGRDLPLKVVELATGTQVFDWALPREWNVREAWAEAPDGSRVIDMADSTLHVLGYSTPVEATIDIDELRSHLYTDPRDADAVPYRTSYWEERWGFCTSRRVADRLVPGRYRVRIDSSLEPGHVTYGEVALAGAEDGVFLITTTVCHPSLANDNLSGVVLLADSPACCGHRSSVTRSVSSGARAPIGPLCWLHSNATLVRVRHGFAVSCVGDPGPLTYKRSRRGRAEIDQAAALVLRHAEGASIRDWSPYGGDERQFCSPGFDLPFGALSRISPAERVPRVPLLGRRSLISCIPDASR